MVTADVGSPPTGPLAGVLVADFSRVLAGPLCSMTLADLGATVVKVERPGVGDDTRSWGPPWSPAPDGPGESGASGESGEPGASGASDVPGGAARSATYFDSINRSKRSVTLDLRGAADNALARELARRADVVVENFRPGALDRLGLGYEQVRATNPGVVYASLTGFGRGGGADLLGYDFLVQAVGGLMSITGTPEEEPAKVGVALVDVLAGKDATIGIMAALMARGRDGVGRRVEVSLLSSLLAAMVNQGQSYLSTGVAPGRMGNAHPSIAPYETLHCRDGLLAVACGNDGQFARLVAALGDPGLAADPRFATNADRVGHRPELVAALESLLGAADAGAWQERLTAAQVPAGRVGTLADGFALAKRLGLDPWTDVGGGGAPRPQTRHPVRYDPALTNAPIAPPALGAHDAEVRAWLSTPDASPLEQLTPPSMHPAPPPPAPASAQTTPSRKVFP